ncbi:intercompartmental signaling factor BofC [Halalkalibacterium halodurans]|uniref:intercompartmental signaling factor BofC n=1 Tax=Halalkalibacterium halodurans TaxID=86665 RepID=UPI002E1D2273|nr:intercompartmental signaling factor BofC [Halalkalibacterium halodurans]
MEQFIFMKMVFRSILAVMVIVNFFLISSIVAMGGNQFAVAAETHSTAISVRLERHYVDGEISEEYITEPIETIEQLMGQYHGWIFVSQNGDEMILKKDVPDLSPLTKANGFFSISNDGQLNLYDGSAEEQPIIQSFFRLDTKKLESGLHDQLRSGIRIGTLDDYREVLSICLPYRQEEM